MAKTVGGQSVATVAGNTVQVEIGTDQFPQVWQSALYAGTGVNNNDILFTTSDLTGYNSFLITCTAGIGDVEVSPDNVNWFGPIPLPNSVGAATTNEQLNSASENVAMLRGTYKYIRVRQKGATATTMQLLAGVM